MIFYIYCAALENSRIMQFMVSRPWNAPPPVFCRLINMSKLQLKIFKIRVLTFNQGIVTALFINLSQGMCNFYDHNN